jgi:hypothetical protein
MYTRCITVGKRLELLAGYDDQLGGSQHPDPNFLAILFLMSKDFLQWEVEAFQNSHPNLNNPWLRLAARVMGRLDIPDGSYVSMELVCDHKVHTIIAAQSLLRYAEEESPSTQNLSYWLHFFN